MYFRYPFNILFRSFYVVDSSISPPKHQIVCDSLKFKNTQLKELLNRFNM